MPSTTHDLHAPLHRLSVDQYRRMGEAGVFDGDVHVELIDGLIVEMNPAGWRHMRAVAWLIRVLVPQVPAEHVVWPQQGVSLPALRSMPEPDIAILAIEEVLAEVDGRPLLVIEVSDASLRFDRITKARLYARHGIEEYWIVNVDEAVVEVHRQPGDGVWGTRTVHGPAETLRPLLLGDVGVDLAPLFAFVAADPVTRTGA